MIYSRGMPRLTPQVRLSRLTPLDLAGVRLSPSEALAQADMEQPNGRVTLGLLKVCRGRHCRRMGVMSTLRGTRRAGGKNFRPGRRTQGENLRRSGLPLEF